MDDRIWDIRLPVKRRGWDGNGYCYAYSVWGNGGDGQDHWGWPAEGPMRCINWNNHGSVGCYADFQAVLDSPGECSTDFAFITRIWSDNKLYVYCKYFSDDLKKQTFNPIRKGDIIESHRFTVNLPPVPRGYINADTKILAPSVWGNAGRKGKEDHWGWPREGAMEIINFRPNSDNTASFEVILKSPGENSMYLAFICRIKRVYAPCDVEHDVFCRYIPLMGPEPCE